jgi:GNAT superfamily N-acetyltransferase
MSVRVRLARLDEAAILAELANDLNDHVGVSGRPFTAARIRADGFGADALFTPLVAELDGAVVGYAFFSPGYNTDLAARSMWLHDIFVVPAARGRGVGRALMGAVAAETVRLGYASLDWGVHRLNTGALEFYSRLGAGGGDVRIMGVDGEDLRALAAASVTTPGRRPRSDAAPRS